MTQLDALETLADIQRAAEDALPDHVVTMLAGGFNDEITYLRTQQVLEAISLRPRRLAGLSTTNCSTTVLGTPTSLPVLPAPAAPHFACHSDAELAVTPAVARSETVQIVPHMGYWSFTDCAQATTGPLWAQAFFLTDRGRMRELISEIEACDLYKALVLTVDSPSMNGRREQEIRLPTVGVDTSDKSAVDVSNVLEKVYERMAGTDIGQSWEYIDWIRSTTSLPLVLKGILRADMAEESFKRGAQAIVVSSHGSRLFDGHLASVEALSEIYESVVGRMEIYYDGGIRTGSDIVKVIALGARAVLIGRPIFYGLATGGEDGVHRTLELLRAEVSTALRAIGRASVADVSRDDVRLLRQAPTHRLASF